MKDRQTHDRKPRFARVKWFQENYGLTRYLLLRMVEKNGVTAIRTDDKQTGVLLFSVRDVEDVLKERYGRVKVKGRGRPKKAPACHPAR